MTTTTDCAGAVYSPSNEDGNTIIDPNGTTCHIGSADWIGYCCGDAATTDCNGNYYSPSNEDGNTITDPNETTCHIGSADWIGYCCGDFGGSQDCNGNYYSPSNEDGGLYTFVQTNLGQLTGVVCSNASAFPQNPDQGYNGACVCFNQADCAGTVITPENFWIDGYAGVCASSSAGCYGYCCQFDMGGDCALTSDPCNYFSFYDCQGTPCGPAVSGSYGNCLGVPVFPDPSQVRSGVDFGFNASQTGTLVATAARPSVNIGALIGLPPFIQL